MSACFIHPALAPLSIPDTLQNLFAEMHRTFRARDQRRLAGTTKLMSRRVMRLPLVSQRFPETRENFFAASFKTSPVTG
jgi:hypothetical protein